MKFVNTKLISLKYKGEIWKAEPGVNCPLFNLITTENECADAADHLGHIFQWHTTGADLPAGCIYNVATSRIFLNREIDPANTSPRIEYGGVCKGEKNGILRKPLFHFRYFDYNLIELFSQFKLYRFIFHYDI